MPTSRRALLALGVALFAFGLAQAKAEGEDAPLPEEFINRAAIAGIYEVEAARIALDKAREPDLKAFASTMIADHTATNEELRRVAGDFPIPQALDSAHQERIDQLNAASVADFDRLYWQQQTDAHKDAVSLFTKYSTEGGNGAAKGFASKNLPTLQHHQEMLGALEPKLAP